jgi:hypothetical protein
MLCSASHSMRLSFKVGRYTCKREKRKKEKKEKGKRRFV